MDLFLPFNNEIRNLKTIYIYKHKYVLIGILKFSKNLKYNRRHSKLHLLLKKVLKNIQVNFYLK